MMAPGGAVEALVDARREHGALLVVCNGGLARLVHRIGDDDRVFYAFGGMGLAAAVGTGLAYGAGEPVIVADGDGNLLMNLAGPLLPSIAGVRRFAHVVFDNGMYATTGGHARPAPGFSFAEHARNAGYDQVFEPQTPAELRAAIGNALVGKVGMITCRVGPFEELAPRPAEPPEYFTRRLRAELGATT